MSEVTEGELVMWSVDPGPMAGALELKLWRIATAARSYLNRMRAAELAHGVVAGERDAVIVERDEAKEACDLLEMERDDACGKLDDLRADLHNVRAHSVAAEEARDLAIVERDEAYRQRDSALSSLSDRRREVVSLHDAAESHLEALAEARRERDEALKARITAQRDRLVADHHAVVSSEPYKAMEAERDALESQVEDARDILGAAPDELLSDAARRAMSEPENVSDAANTLSEAFLIDDFGNSIEDLAKQAADQIASVRGSLLVPDDGMVAIHARDIRDSLAGERGATVAERVALVMAELRRLRAAEAEPPQVFRIKAKVTIGHDYDDSVYASVAVDEITDPGFLALSGHQFSQLGLVVCDD